MINCSHVLLGGFEGMLIRRECWYNMAQFKVYFGTIFPSVNFDKILLNKNIQNV